MDVIKAWKRIGETPLQALNRVRHDYHVPGGKPGCYAGRLDPLAQGVITMLYGNAIHQAKIHNHADKIYKFQAVLGVSTTSYDPLGRITNYRQINSDEAENFQTELLKLSGNHDLEQPLPPCSAYRFQGKPLWKHVIDGTVPDPLPSKMVKIYSVSPLHAHPTMVNLKDYRKECIDDINDFQCLNATASFHFNEIRQDWNDLDDTSVKHLWRICFYAKVGSGTFIRSLVSDTGRRLGIPAHAFRIIRIGTIASLTPNHDTLSLPFHS